MNPVRPCPIRTSSNRARWFYTYVLLSKKDRKFYTGTTNNLKERLKQHTLGLVLATKYRRPFELIYFEACRNKDDAYRRERYLKTTMGKRYLRNRIKGGLTG